MKSKYPHWLVRFRLWLFGWRSPWRTDEIESATEAMKPFSREVS